MNRFVASGLLDEMQSGKRIVVLSCRATRQTFNELVKLIPVGATDIHFRAGRITSTLGGSIEFGDPHELHRIRGVVADLVYVDDPGRRLTHDQMDRIAPIIAGSPSGEIVHA